MSADEHLNPQQFFHGTHVRLTPGDFIEPGHGANFDYEPGEHEGVQSATTNLVHARNYAKTAARINTHDDETGYVYQVRPVGQVNSSGRGITEDEHVAPKWEVLHNV